MRKNWSLPQQQNTFNLMIPSPADRSEPENRQNHPSPPPVPDAAAATCYNHTDRSPKLKVPAAPTHRIRTQEHISAPEIILLILQHEFVAATCLTGGRPQGRPRTPSSGLGAPQIPQVDPEVSLRRRSGVPAQPAATVISGG